MATITAAMVKELRDKTGAGMMDCKTALTEVDGDSEAAIDWLRTKGLAKAANKADRIAAEGLIGLSGDDGRGAVVEVNSETDFVARNEQFQELVRGISELALKTGGNIDKLSEMDYPGAGKSVKDHVTELVGTIGENLNLRRSAGLEVAEGVVAQYLHGAVTPGLGKIGVLVALESSGDKDKLLALGKQVAMHIAATSPIAITPDELDEKVVARERDVLSEQARESGKPEEIIQKMVEGRIRKFYEEVVLEAQTFVIDGETKVGKVVEAAAKDIGAPIKIAGFVRFGLGEGIEKEEDDFAAEVAAAASGS